MQRQLATDVLRALLGAEHSDVVSIDVSARRPSPAPSVRTRENVDLQPARASRAPQVAERMLSSSL
eukprot:2967985-Pyramimonas_sp.AAC.1